MVKWKDGEPVWAPGRARWKQIADELRSRILAERYRPGSQLPSITTFEQEFWVTRNTMRKSLRFLADEGLIRAEPGVGTFVIYGLVDEE